MSPSVHKHLSIYLIIRIVFLSLLIIFIVNYVYTNWSMVLQVGAPDWSWILIASLFAMFSILLSPWMYKLLVQAYGYKLPYTTVLGIQSVSRLGKYIPGKIWAVLMGVWLYEQVGIPKKITTASIILISIFSILGAAIIISLGAWWLPISGIFAGLTFIIISLLIAIHPNIFYPFLNYGLRILKREKITPPNVKYASILLLIITYSLIWILYGIGFYFLVRSYTPLSTIQIFPLISIFALAQIAGFLVIIAPAGLGVREGVLLLGLTPIVGEGQAIVLVGLCRLWQTILELLMAMTGTYFIWKNKIPILKKI